MDRPRTDQPRSFWGPAIAVLAGLVMVGLMGMGACVLVIAQFASDTSAPSLASATPTPVPGPVLELQSVRWSRSEGGGYAVAEGEVKNISSQPLRNAKAVAMFFTASETFITSEDSLLDYNPVLPGQASPFKVMAIWNPQMRRAVVDFRTFEGAVIPWREKPATKRK